ncbi:MAG: hydroxyacid dehydrogenase [Calditrichaeota bacterium]|nr:MAG: hydroxyacid dehydrogenase [Calditrichota bacterium]
MTNHEQPASQIIIYQTESGQTKIEVRLQDETVWLPQKLMAELFQTTKQNISLHINNIFKEDELDEYSVVKDFLTTAADGKNYSTKFYNLEAIIAVGYRVRSHRGTQFRRWATERLNEYVVKGFTLDDERLKNVQNVGSDYFDEMLERIRDIRSSEQRFYHKIKEIYKLAVDYDPKAEETIEFFKAVQNKLHFAISGQTAAELIAGRADASKPRMGLTSWKGDKVRKSDVTIAKNYLNEEELEALNRVVTMYLDFAEDQAKRHKQVFMRDWRDKLDAFLQFNERNILTHAGKISHEFAKTKAEKEYVKFNRKRIKEKDQELSDFDKTVKKIQSEKKKLSGGNADRGKNSD